MAVNITAKNIMAENITSLSLSLNFVYFTILIFTFHVCRGSTFSRSGDVEGAPVEEDPFFVAAQWFVWSCSK
jgi:hypothetical protein